MIKIQQGLWLLLLVFLPNSVFADSDNPCSGPEQLLNLINRPTYADSACTVPNHERVLEQGYQSERLRGGGQLEIFPSAQLRFGLAHDNEINVWIPTYNKETVTPHTGFSSISFGYKQEIGYGKDWVFSLEGYATPPSGSWTFGSKGEGIFQGIFYIALNEKISLSFQLGISSETDTPYDGGRRFSSINPDLVITYSLRDNLDFYGEIYGQTKTASNEGMGYNADAGFIFLVNKHLTLDIEAGQRIRGNLAGLENYIGAGMALQF